jgi:pimeloyl-ACP methyl ester carboxylesterase
VKVFSNPAVEIVPIPVFTTKEGEQEALAAYQAVMDLWAPGYEDLYVPTSFGLTHVIANGALDAPPLVLLHALFATATSWYRNVPELSKHYRTYCVDVIGEANLSQPTKPITSLDDFLTWFMELLDRLEISTLFLGGNSYGGFTAVYYSMKLPERVRKVFLVGPAATISPMSPFFRHMFLPKAVYSMLPWAPGVERVMRRSVDWMHAGLATDPSWEPLFYKTMVHGKLINRVYPRVYTQDEFAEIEAPVLLVVGEEEVIYDDLDSAVESARHLFPDIQVALIPNAHHITALAQPELTNDKVIEFLTSS